MPNDFRTLFTLSDAPRALAEGAKTIRQPFLKTGTYNYRGKQWTVDEPLFDRLIENHTKVMGGRVAMDVDHAAERTGNRNTAAYAWITGLEKNGNELEAIIEPNAKGQQIIEGHEYEKVSGVLGPHTDEFGVTHPDCLHAISFTNRPFLKGLPAVSLMDDELAAQLAQPDAGTDSNALADGSYRIDNVPQLKSAIAFAKNGHGDVAAAKPHIARRARELGRSDLHPWQWGQVPEPAALDAQASNLDQAMAIALAAGGDPRAPAPGAPTRSTPAAVPATGGPYTLDSSPQALLQDEMALNALAGAVVDSTGAAYHEVVVALSQVADSRTVRDALGRLGQTAGIYVRELAAVETGLRELEARQQQQVRMLEASEQVLADEDEAGRVMLDQGFDRVGYRHDPIAQDRDFERAKQLSSQYASRARFDADNMLYLDSGLSLVKSLERPAQRKQVKMALAAQPAASSATVRTLDSAEPVKFVSLSAEAMLLALSEWEARGRDKVTLDECAAIVSGHELSSVDGERDGDDVLNTVGPTNPAIGGMGAGHHELDQRIRSHMLEHGCKDYHCGLNAVTGIQFAPVVGA